MFDRTELIVGNGIEAQLPVTVIEWEGRWRQLPKRMESAFVDVDKLARLEDKHRWVVIHSSALLNGIYRRPIWLGTKAVAMGQTVQTVVFGPLLLHLIVENVQSSLFVLLGHSTKHDNFVVPREAGVTTIDCAMTILMEMGE